ncbi:MAG TPA: hypothetical protein VGM06_25830 [Polyangiaceae bacterium]|jgi:hypothetical protein
MNPSTKCNRYCAVAVQCLALSVWLLTVACDATDTVVISDGSITITTDANVDASLDGSLDGLVVPRDATADACGDTASDPRNCGACGVACGAGQACVQGACTVACSGMMATCGGACVDTSVDPSNCGGCGHACSTGQVCSGGTCSATCSPQLAACAADGGAVLCLDTQTDDANCGACGNACAPGQVCSGATCRATCQSTETECTAPASIPYCAITATDNANCGACGNACPAGQVCSAGVCGLTCQDGLIDCNGTCVDPSSSRAFCGATGACQGTTAGTACAAGQICNAGLCALSCPGNQVNCNGTCISAATDRQFCGASADCQGPHAGTACATGQVCSSGACGVSCQAGLVNCGGTCVDPATDNRFCGVGVGCVSDGGVGGACTAGQVCSAGACGLTCQAGLVECNGTCVNPMTDRQFCGASGACTGASAGTACPSGQVCNGSGVCAVSCPAGEIDCSGTCVDPSTSNQFCGATTDCMGPDVGTTCMAGTVCSGGVCGLSCQTGESVTNSHCCPNGQFYCSGKCVDPTIDSQFCNIHSDCTAGVSCGQGRVCSNSTCAATCATPLVLNGGVCVNPTALTTCGATTGSLGTDCSDLGQVCVTTGSTSACGCPPGESAGDGGGTHCCPTGQYYCVPNFCFGLDPDVDATLLACSPALPHCIDPLVDSLNCGIHADCTGGSSCGEGRVCSGGACSATCAPPLFPLFDDDAGVVVCVNPTSITTCGATGSSPGTDCSLTGEICDASTNPPTCACPGGEVAQSGLCCPTGQINCGSKCVDPLNDNAFCGATGDCGVDAGSVGTACPAGEVCSGGSCGLTCQAGLLNCNGHCIDPQTDTSFCGATGGCGFDGGSAGATCSGGQSCEADAGGCQCPSGQSLSNGQCCPTGQTSCGGTCVDLTTNAANCSTCMHSCTNPTALHVATNYCAGSTCGFTCTSPFMDCNTMAADGCESNTGTDPNNCGFCGNICPSRANATRTCTSGTCGFTCTGTFQDCDGNPTNGCEVDTSNSVSHCGSCVTACPTPPHTTGPACSASLCRYVSCVGPFADCNGDPSDGCEVNTNTDPLNCGSCGDDCELTCPLCTMCSGGFCD